MFVEARREKKKTLSANLCLFCFILLERIVWMAFDDHSAELERQRRDIWIEEHSRTDITGKDKACYAEYS